MLTDFQIRQQLLKNLNKSNVGKEYRIIEELSICDGVARADVTVANGIFHGFEIKSDADSLDRLNNQVKMYNATFDRCTIVVGKKFENKIEQFVPSHWGIMLAYQNRFGNITIKPIRAALKNDNVTYTAMTDLLWNKEITRLLKLNKVRGYSGKSKPQLSLMVMQKIKLPDLKKYTRETIKFREGWRAD